MARTRHFSLTRSGTQVRIRIRGILHTRHFKRGTDPLLMKQWLLATELRYRGAKASRSGLFADDAQVYLEAVRSMPSYADRARHIAEWIAVFGNQPRSAITASQIATQLATWSTEPRDVVYTRVKTEKVTRLSRRVLSASSVNKRRTALMHLFTVLDGKAAVNPVKDVPKFREPDPLPRGLPYPAIRQLWAVLGTTPTCARLKMLAYVGLTHSQIAALKPEHINAGARTIQVTGRRKGKGTATSVRPLTSYGLQACRMMARTDAWGPFSRSTLHRFFRAACRDVPALKPLADRLTPYDLRHSFGTEVYRVSGDIRATQALLGHSTPTLTNRYTLGAVDVRMTAALKGFGRR